MNVLVLECGRPPPTVDSHFGGFGRWFRDALPFSAVTVVPAYARRAIDLDPRSFDRVIVTGSPSSVTERQPWMKGTARFVLGAAEQRVPVLGVCFGHQLIAAAIGGRVGPQPDGWEAGTVECELTLAGRRDSLFGGVPARFRVHAAHEESVLALPASAEVLAFNERTAIQAFRAGPFLQGVQFHPEMSASTLAAYLSAVRGHAAPVVASPHGRSILENFIRSPFEALQQQADAR